MPRPSGLLPCVSSRRQRCEFSRGSLQVHARGPRFSAFELGVRLLQLGLPSGSAGLWREVPRGVQGWLTSWLHLTVAALRLC